MKSGEGRALLLVGEAEADLLRWQGGHVFRPGRPRQGVQADWLRWQGGHVFRPGRPRQGVQAALLRWQGGEVLRPSNTGCPGQGVEAAVLLEWQRGDVLRKSNAGQGVEAAVLGWQGRDDLSCLALLRSSRTTGRSGSSSSCFQMCARSGSALLRVGAPRARSLTWQCRGRDKDTLSCLKCRSRGKDSLSWQSGGRGKDRLGWQCQGRGKDSLSWQSGGRGKHRPSRTGHSACTPSSTHPRAIQKATSDDPSIVLFPEIVEDDEHEPMRDRVRDVSDKADPPTADVAKARWLVDRGASGDVGLGAARSSSFAPSLGPYVDAGIARMRAKLAQRQVRAHQQATGTSGGRETLYEWLATPQLERQGYRRAERRGGSRGSSMGSVDEQRAAVWTWASQIPRGALYFCLCLACLCSLLIARQARYQPSVDVGFHAAASSASARHGNQVLGHVAVDEAPTSDLIPVLADGSVLLRTAAANAFLHMQAEARRGGVYLLPLSGFRSVQDQQHVFYGVKAARNQNIRDRAKVSAPPGFSEHHTGYALDIGDASAPRSHLEFDFEDTDAFRWLQNNANRFHFELSFPPDNKQGIMYEPWHWRFVGNDHATVTFYGS